MKKPLFRALALTGAALLLAACAAGTSRDDAKTPEITAESRAQARWDSLIAGKAEDAYAFFSPGVRSTHPLETYVTDLANRPVKWVKATIVGKNCEEDSCTVDVEVEYKVDLPARGVGTVQVPHRQQERWILLDGTWYFVPDDVATGGLR